MAVIVKQTRESTNDITTHQIGGFFLFAVQLARGLYCHPPFIEADRALGAMMGARLIPMGDGQNRR